mgnify:CR=1 FL=1
MEELKKIAGVTAAKYVEDGMVVGLGTGSTAYFFVEEIGRRIKEEGLSVVGVTTSSQTTKQAEGLGIPLKAVDDIDSIDVTVDGADEVDPQLNGIKGGGGALLMEKIVATPTKEYIWVVDESKMVDQLGAFKLPVEVVQYGADRLYRVFESKGYKPSFRLTEQGDSWIEVLDLDLGKIENPVALGEELKAMTGVVDHGLFNGMVNKVIVAGKDGVKVVEVKA